MVDTKAISKTMISKLKQGIFGKSTYGNKEWKKANNGWYAAIHDSNYLLHENFIQYFKEKSDIKTILEVGCGTGIYPIRHPELFAGKRYTGMDISQANIDFCKTNSEFEFICGDVIKMEFKNRYDLVFSHAVVDHVYDIDRFIINLLKACKKYAYINSYRGFFPDLKKHKMEWREADGCYYNDLSIKQVTQLLIDQGLKENEFLIRSQESGQKDQNVNMQTVIEIKRNPID